MKIEFDCAFTVYFSPAGRFRSATVPVVVGGAKPNENRVAALFQAHLEHALAVYETLVRILARESLSVSRNGRKGKRNRREEEMPIF